MISDPHIIETIRQDVAAIHIVVPRNEMMKVFGPAVQDLMQALAAQDIQPNGALTAHHLVMRADCFDFELCVPVAASVAPAGRVIPSVLPAALVARTVYQGPYEGLPAAWAEFDGWIAKSAHQKASDLWEVYSVGPQSGLDPSHWRTELNRPLLPLGDKGSS